MPETRLSIRIDENIKKEAEAIFRDMGLTLSAGVSLYLYRVAAEKGIPFPLVQVSNRDSHTASEPGRKMKATHAKAQAAVEKITYQRR